MSKFRPINQLAAVYKQYGPGRLPLADRRDIGAGYAMATTAAVATTIAVVTGLIFEQIFAPRSLLSIVPVYGYYAFPLVTPIAFISGVGTWRYLPSDISYFDFVAGVVATLSTYLIGSPIGSVLFNIQVAQSSEVPLVDIFASVVFYTFVIGLIALMSTFWVTFPLGALGGAIYERTQ